MSEEKADASIHEEQATKKQKVEDETNPTQQVLENGFYTKNFGENSEFYKFLKKASDIIRLIYERYKEDSEDFECLYDQMSGYQNNIPAMFADKIDNILESIDRDYSEIDKLLAKRNEEKSKK